MREEEEDEADDDDDDAVGVRGGTLLIEGIFGTFAAVGVVGVGVDGLIGLLVFAVCSDGINRSNGNSINPCSSSLNFSNCP